MRDMGLALEDTMQINGAPGVIGGDEAFDAARATLAWVRTCHRIPLG
jgi:hypothetical protein